MRNNNEIDKYYNIRKIFINFHKKKNKKDLKLIEMYSHILINMLFLKCRYKLSTEKIIKNFLSKNKKEIIQYINSSLNI